MITKLEYIEPQRVGMESRTRGILLGKQNEIDSYGWMKGLEQEGQVAKVAKGRRERDEKNTERGS